MQIEFILNESNIVNKIQGFIKNIIERLLKFIEKIKRFINAKRELLMPNDKFIQICIKKYNSLTQEEKRFFNDKMYIYEIIHNPLELREIVVGASRHLQQRLSDMFSNYTNEEDFIEQSENYLNIKDGSVRFKVKDIKLDGIDTLEYIFKEIKNIEKFNKSEEMKIKQLYKVVKNNNTKDNPDYDKSVKNINKLCAIYTKSYNLYIKGLFKERSELILILKSFLKTKPDKDFVNDEYDDYEFEDLFDDFFDDAD